MRRTARFFVALLLANGLLLGVHGARAQVGSPAPAAAKRSKDRSNYEISFYRELAKRPGNIFAGPYSLEMAMAMAQAGARGQTAKEFANVLGNNPASGLAAPAGDGLTFEVANALWAQRELALKSDYLAAIRARFSGSVGTLNFSAPTSAADAMNRWASDKTHGRIQSVVSPAALSSDTRLVLTDAVYFKGVWESPFAAGDTHRELFDLASGREVQTDTMHQTSNFEIYLGKGFKLLVMYFKGGAEPVQMVILLPDKPNGLPALETKLNATSLDGWISNAKERLVDVALPKFTHANTVQLRDVVSSMGLADAFSTTQADFSGIAPLTRPRLHLSDVIQSVFVDLNESGAEAAAVTAVTMTMATARWGEISNPSVPFIADHPFLYLIRDEKTDDILFIGRMEDPA